MVWPLLGFFPDFHLFFLECGYFLLLLHVCLEKLTVFTLIYFDFTWKILDILCRNNAPKIRVNVVEKNRWVQNKSGGFLTFFVQMKRVVISKGVCAMWYWRKFTWHHFHTVVLSTYWVSPSTTFVLDKRWR